MHCLDVYMVWKHSKSDMERLESYQRKICRQLQQLPERYASTAVYIYWEWSQLRKLLTEICYHSSWALPVYQNMSNSRFYSVSYIWLIHMTRTLFVVSENPKKVCITITRKHIRCTTKKDMLEESGLKYNQ